MKLFKKKKRGGNIWPFSYYNNIFTLVLSGFTTSTRLNRKRSDTILPSFVLKKKKKTFIEFITQLLVFYVWFWP